MTDTIPSDCHHARAPLGSSHDSQSCQSGRNTAGAGLVVVVMSAATRAIPPVCGASWPASSAWATRSSSTGSRTTTMLASPVELFVVYLRSKTCLKPTRYSCRPSWTGWLRSMAKDNGSCSRYFLSAKELTRPSWVDLVRKKSLGMGRALSWDLVKV